MSDSQASSGSAIPAIAAQSLNIGHDSPVITNATFTIPNGKLTAIIGPNGSGKSTLLHVITGLLKPIEGTIQVLGQDPSVAQSQISYVLQYTAVPKGTPLTVRETVAMGRYPNLGWFRRLRQNDRAKVHDAMAQLDVTDLAGRHLSELSGGQRQRVYVAQGIAQEHQLLIMDEPLTGLDITSAKTIDRIIHSETEHGCTVVLTTHDLDEARAADFVLLLGQGRVISGTPEHVLTQQNLQFAYGLGAHHPLQEGSTELPTPHHPELVE
jgi:iron complex transport system ATP-binding protein